MQVQRGEETRWGDTTHDQALLALRLQAPVMDLATHDSDLKLP